MVGVILYSMFFKDFEIRTLLWISCVTGLVAGAFDICYILGLNVKMGIPDSVYLCFNVLVFSCLNLAFIILPMQVLFIKITP